MDIEDIYNKLNKIDKIERNVEAILLRLSQQTIPDEVGDINFAAGITKLSTSTLYKRISQKKIDHIKLDGKLLFSRKKLEALLNQSEIKAQ